MSILLKDNMNRTHMHYFTIATKLKNQLTASNSAL